MTLPTPDIDPTAELPETTVYGRSWDSPVPALPAPLLTSVQSVEMGWQWWPSMVLTLERRAIHAGWVTQCGFSRGYKPGRARGTFDLLDVVAVHVRKPGVRGGFMWNRLVDGSYEWKPAGAWFRSGGRLAAMGHTEAKRRL